MLRKTQMIVGQRKTQLRLALAVALIVVIGILLVNAGGLFPDRDTSVSTSQIQLCETIAISSSALLAHNDVAPLKRALDGLVRHHPQIQSINLRKLGGELLDASDRALADRLSGQVSATGDISTTSEVLSVDEAVVPLRINGRPWGTAEIVFTPRAGNLWAQAWQQPWIQLLLGLGALCCLSCWLYRSRCLKPWDLGNPVPGHVCDALNGLAQSLLVVDQRGSIRFCNRAFTELIGSSNEQLLGQSISRLPWRVIQATERSASEAKLEMPWRLTSEQSTACVGERLELIAGDGSIRTLKVSCSPVLGPNGLCRGVMICCDDVTHLEQLKQQLRLAKDQADAASAAKTAFVANMSHEIRTPLNAVLGFADILRRGMAQSRAEEVEYLDLIHRSGRHLLDLINNVLDLSKIELGHLQVEILSFAPHRVLSEVVSVLRTRALERGIQLTASIEGELPREVESDPTKLRQILMNLIANAIKFTEVGRVEARMSASAGPKPILKIEISDTGIGMTTEQQARVFNAFEQADNSTTRRFGGTGLGLSISRQFAEALGGTLTVSSRLAEGSTFTLCIPFPLDEEVPWMSGETLFAELTRQQAPGDTVPSIQFPATPILVADDGEANRKVISLVLQRAGAVVSTAADGYEALKLMAEHDFAAVLMDMQMLPLNGYDATKLIRSTGCQVPIIALTGNTLKEEQQRCLDSGCNAFLTKPVQVDRLLATLAQIIGSDQCRVECLEDDLEATSTESTQAGSITPRATRNLERETLDQLRDTQRELDQALRGPLYSSLPTDDLEMAEIVCDFVPRMRERIGVMETQFLAESWSALENHAHWLKGAAGTTGFLPISEQAHRLLDLISVRDVEGCRQCIASITELAGRVMVPQAVY